MRSWWIARHRNPPVRVGALDDQAAGASTAFAQIDAKVDTNGILKGYTVQKNGRTVCKDPKVWNGFRGEGSINNQESILRG